MSNSLRILALETSAMAGSVAAWDGSVLLAERVLEPSQRSAQSLAPALSEVLASVGWKPRDVQMVAVAAGPGSFTGLRVGVTTAKTFAYAVEAEVIGVNTLDCIARQAPADAAHVAAVIDAQRQQLFVRHYHRHGDGLLHAIDEPRIVDASAWLADIGPTVVTGPGLEKWGTKLAPSVRVTDRACWSPRASTVGALAFERYSRGERDDLWTLAPMYLRKSAAEETLEERP